MPGRHLYIPRIEPRLGQRLPFVTSQPWNKTQIESLELLGPHPNAVLSPASHGETASGPAQDTEALILVRLPRVGFPRLTAERKFPESKRMMKSALSPHLLPQVVPGVSLAVMHGEWASTAWPQSAGIRRQRGGKWQRKHRLTRRKKVGRCPCFAVALVQQDASFLSQ